MLNAGTDMMMIPSKQGYQEYIAGVKMGLSNGTIMMDRVNDAVAKIISVKLALGIAN